MEEIIVICVLESNIHTAEAQKSKCNFCGTGVWCQPWNMKEKKICFSCTGKIKDATFSIKPEDLIRASEEIKKLSRGR